jgi:hypothetical protein
MDQAFGFSGAVRDSNEVETRREVTPHGCDSMALKRSSIALIVFLIAWRSALFCVPRPVSYAV